MEAISGLCYYPVYKVFEDFCKICSCSLHNTFKDAPVIAHSYYRDLFISREQEFKNIANKYDKAVFNEYFPSLMAILARLLLESPKDYLGTIFARLNLGQHYRGQFFTPSHICEFMAEITFNESLEKAIQEKGYCRVAEPTCGSGAMVLGLVKCLQNRGIEKLGGKLYIEATDIDELCVCMTYTQLSLLGLSVRVIHGNSLSGEIFSTWDSPNLQIANLSGYFN